MVGPCVLWFGVVDDGGRKRDNFEHSAPGAREPMEGMLPLLTAHRPWSEAVFKTCLNAMLLRVTDGNLACTATAKTLPPAVSKAVRGALVIAGVWWEVEPTRSRVI